MPRAGTLWAPPGLGAHGHGTGCRPVDNPRQCHKLRGVKGGQGSPRESSEEEQERKRKVRKRVIKEMGEREIIQGRIRNVQSVSVPGNINHAQLEGDSTLPKET